MAVQLCNELNETSGPAALALGDLMFDYPTIDALAKSFAGSHVPSDRANVLLPQRRGRDEVVERLDRAAVAAMSDDDIAKLLDQRLEAQ